MCLPSGCLCSISRRALARVELMLHEHPVRWWGRERSPADVGKWWDVRKPGLCTCTLRSLHPRFHPESYNGAWHKKRWRQRLFLSLFIKKKGSQGRAEWSREESEGEGWRNRTWSAMTGCKLRTTKGKDTNTMARNTAARVNMRLIPAFTNQRPNHPWLLYTVARASPATAVGSAKGKSTAASNACHKCTL